MKNVLHCLDALEKAIDNPKTLPNDFYDTVDLLNVVTQARVDIANIERDRKLLAQQAQDWDMISRKVEDFYISSAKESRRISIMMMISAALLIPTLIPPIIYTESALSLVCYGIALICWSWVFVMNLKQYRKNKIPKEGGREH